MSAVHWFLIDNGSVKAESHLLLRDIAMRVSEELKCEVEAVSLAHSDRIPSKELSGKPALLLEERLRELYAQGCRRFVVIPLFVASCGGIVHLLHRKLAELEESLGGVDISLAPFLYDTEEKEDTLARLLSDNVMDLMKRNGIKAASIIVLDHGSPLKEAVDVRNEVAGQLERVMGDFAVQVSPASMERRLGDQYAFNEPLLKDLLGSDGYDSGDVIIAPLFFLPGRHAGEGGDVDRIIADASIGDAAFTVHRADVIGKHARLPHCLADVCKIHESRIL